jgi:glycosyltransferase involved in cell wall biosynthesis
MSESHWCRQYGKYEENMPKVSVIIPTHNRSQLLPRAINSVLNQTYKDFELIIVDDASTDNTAEIVSRFNDPSIKYYKNEINRGLPASRNIGIKNSTANFLGFLDDDDAWEPTKLEKQLVALQDSDSKVGLIYCHYRRINANDGSVIDEVAPLFRGKVGEYIIANCFIASGSPIVRKECFGKVGLFDEGLQGCEDWDMWIRISKYYEFDLVPESLLNYYIHDSISSNIDQKINAWTRIIKKHTDDFAEYPRLFSMNINHLLKLHIYKGNRFESWKLIAESLKHNKMQRKIFFYFLISFLPEAIRRLLISKYMLSLSGVPRF